MTRVRLQDIADQVEVSRAAVSKVLNRRPIRIGPKKRKRIIALAKELGYRPNIMARALNKKGTRSIGVVVPSMKTLFYPELIEAIETSLFSRGYQTLTCNSDDNPSCEHRHIEDLLSRQIERLVISPASGDENVAFLRSIPVRACPVIFVDRYWAGDEFPYVTTDNYEGARKGVRFLVRQGVSSVFYVGESCRNQPLEDRLAGVRDEAVARKLRFNRRHVFLCSFDREEIRRAAAPILKKAGEGVGIFLESNRFLLGFLDAVREKNLAIPDDLTVIGFDVFRPGVSSSRDLHTLEALNKPVPVIRQDIEKIGSLASEYLLANQAEREGDWQIKVPAKLVIH